MDCANGAASELAPQLFRMMGAEVVAINSAPDGKNINAGCGSLHPEAMQKLVVESGATLGVAFDGDADRAIFSSASGKLVDGDGVLLVAGRYLKSAGKLKGNVIVGTTMANLGLERALDQSGLKLVRTAVGDRYMLKRCCAWRESWRRTVRAFFSDDAGDGMLTAVKSRRLYRLPGRSIRSSRFENLPTEDRECHVKSKPPLESSGGFAGAQRSGKGAR